MPLLVSLFPNIGLDPVVDDEDNAWIAVTARETVEPNSAMAVSIWIGVASEVLAFSLSIISWMLDLAVYPVTFCLRMSC